MRAALLSGQACWSLNLCNRVRVIVSMF
uniref:Uncharacterized protein n=1 Tax=Arundo donax TaxID=35708 RepID=A0A0A9BW58_ARUDO